MGSPIPLSSSFGMSTKAHIWKFESDIAAAFNQDTVATNLITLAGEGAYNWDDDHIWDDWILWMQSWVIDSTFAQSTQSTNYVNAVLDISSALLFEGHITGLFVGEIQITGTLTAEITSEVQQNANMDIAVVSGGEMEAMLLLLGEVGMTSTFSESSVGHCTRSTTIGCDSSFGSSIMGMRVIMASMGVEASFDIDIISRLTGIDFTRYLLINSESRKFTLAEEDRLITISAESRVLKTTTEQVRIAA